MEASWLWFFIGVPYFRLQLASWNAGLPGPTRVIGSALGWPKATVETGFSHLGGQIPSQKDPRRVPNRGPKAVQVENDDFFENHFFSHFFLRAKAFFFSQKWVQNGIRIASSTRTPSGSLLEASWKPLGSSWDRKKVVPSALEPSWNALGAENRPT